ncbi:hypothetical protein [Nostoc sp. CCY 9925]|uniref:hypothetical protein n=1 Tax=Nostoc sp. CCY 9925 TaxID=3103865 RepID=UPI0039C6BF48
MFASRPTRHWSLLIYPVLEAQTTVLVLVRQFYIQDLRRLYESLASSLGDATPSRSIS